MFIDAQLPEREDYFEEPTPYRELTVEDLFLFKAIFWKI